MRLVLRRFAHIRPSYSHNYEDSAIRQRICQVSKRHHQESRREEVLLLMPRFQGMQNRVTYSKIKLLRVQTRFVFAMRSVYTCPERILMGFNSGCDGSQTRTRVLSHSGLQRPKPKLSKSSNLEVLSLTDITINECCFFHLASIPLGELRMRRIIISEMIDLVSRRLEWIGRRYLV